jgi:hypothetical protein
VKDSQTNSHRRTSDVRDCVCSCGCGMSRMTVPGTPSSDGGIYKANGESGMMRKAFGPEDTDLKKAF